MLTAPMLEALNKDFKKEDKPITTVELNAILDKFESRIKGGVRSRHKKVFTEEALEKRRQRVKNLP